MPLKSDFWDKKSTFYSHGGHEDDSSLEADAEQVVIERLKGDQTDRKAQRLSEQMELIAPAVDQVRRKWDELDQLNFTALEWEIDNELPELNDRTWRKGRKERGRGARGLPAFLGNAVKLLDLKQVVKELETSVMTSVSCSACKAGKSIYSSVRCFFQISRSHQLSQNDKIYERVKLCRSTLMTAF